MKLLIIVVLIVLLVVYFKKPKIERISYKYISKNDFSKRETPCIITNGTSHWPAHTTWSFENFTKRFHNTRFILADNIEPMTFAEYNDYCVSTTEDEPLYIFDESFGEREDTKELLRDYDEPELFSDDLFKNLGTIRPRYRWFIAGPPRSGSNLHVDPLGTSAWNALVTGKKEWIIFYPGAPVRESTKSGAAWFRDEYPKLKHLQHYRFVQKPGEILYIPSGWWHIAINREATMAVTQNFFESKYISKARDLILRERPDIYRKLFLG
jgi:histone arginine demethylase JMJD6